MLEQGGCHGGRKKGRAKCPVAAARRRALRADGNCRCEERNSSSDDRIDVLLEPALEDNQLPQTEGVVTPRGEMFIDEPADEGRLKIPALETPLREQRVREDVAQAAAKPHVERDAKAL